MVLPLCTTSAGLAQEAKSIWELSFIHVSGGAGTTEGWLDIVFSPLPSPSSSLSLTSLSLPFSLHEVTQHSAVQPKLLYMAARTPRGHKWKLTGLSRARPGRCAASAQPQSEPQASPVSRGRVGRRHLEGRAASAQGWGKHQGHLWAQAQSISVVVGLQGPVGWGVN